MRAAILPSILLLALMLFGIHQGYEASTRRPELRLESSLPVVHERRDARPETTRDPCSDQLVEALPEFVTAHLDPAAPTCSDDAEVPLESWAGGRFVWRPGRSLTLETW